jgi:hypothetical protein
MQREHTDLVAYLLVATNYIRDKEILEHLNYCLSLFWKTSGSVIFFMLVVDFQREYMLHVICTSTKISLKKNHYTKNPYINSLSYFLES